MKFFKLTITIAFFINIFLFTQIGMADQIKSLSETPPPPAHKIDNFKNSKPGGVSPYSCGTGGCNCWGSDDCKKLTDSGKCHGNPISCDRHNPKACHCK